MKTFKFASLMGAILLSPSLVFASAIYTFEDPHDLGLDHSIAEDGGTYTGYASPTTGASLEYTAPLSPAGNNAMRFCGGVGCGELPGNPSLNGFANPAPPDHGDPALETGAMSDFGANGFTLAAYIKPDNLAGGNDLIPLIANIDLGYFPYNGFNFGIKSDGSLSIYLQWAPGAQHIVQTTGGGHLAVGQTNHVALRLGNGAMDFFVDGLPVASSKTSGGWYFPDWSPVPGKTGETWIGTVRASWWPTVYTGVMDDVLIHGNAMSDTEILALATNGIPEPATLSLLGLGALSLIRRRK